MYEVKAAGKVSIAKTKEEMIKLVHILQDHGWRVQVRKIGKNPFMAPASAKLVRPNPFVRRRNKNPLSVKGFFGGRYTGPASAAAICSSVEALAYSLTGKDRMAEESRIATLPVTQWAGVLGIRTANVVFGTIVGAYLNNSCGAAYGAICYYNFLMTIMRKTTNMSAGGELFPALAVA